MKKLYTFILLAMGIILPIQAQQALVAKKIDSKPTRKMMRKTVAATDITINDLVGKFDAYAMSAFQGSPDENWSVQITLDETDPNKIWMQPIMQIKGVNLSDIKPIYATYNQDNATITVPLGQSIYQNDYNNLNLVIATSETGATPITTGEVVFNVSGNPRNIVIEADLLLGCGNIIGNEWWYQALGYTTYSKIIPDPLVYVVSKDGEIQKIRAEQLYFNDVEGETYLTNSKEVLLDPIAGTYTAHAMSAFQGSPDEEWTITITYDPSDETKVWIHPICEFANLQNDLINPVYGIFDKSTGDLTIPLGQTLYGGENDPYHFVLGSADNEYNPVITGGLPLKVTKLNNNNFIEIPYIIGVGNLQEGDYGWWYQALGYTQLQGNSGLVCPISEINRITRDMPIPELEGFFNEGKYIWDLNMSMDGETYEQFQTSTQFSYKGEVDLGDFYQGANGVMANHFDVEGFFVDAGFFGPNDTPYSFPAYSYFFESQGQEYEFLDILNPDETGLASIGKMTLRNEDGSSFSTEIYLGELDGQIYTNLNFVVIDGVAVYNGVQAVLWFIQNNQAYLIADFSEIIINKAGANAAPARTKVNFYEKPIPVQLGGTKKFNLKK